jgi:hypothetical protein
MVAAVAAKGQKMKQTEEAVERIAVRAANLFGGIARAAFWHHGHRMSPLAGMPQEM